MRWIGLFLLDGERRPFELDFDIETNSWTHFPEWLQTQLHDYLANNSEPFLTKFWRDPLVGPHLVDPTLDPIPVNYDDEEFVEALYEYNLLPIRPSTCRLRYNERSENPISWYGSGSLINFQETLQWLSDRTVLNISEQIEKPIFSYDEKMKTLWKKYPDGIDRDGHYLIPWVPPPQRIY
tara:strand:+ start:378 stop:917 length:540 start_codon:yes stop_codon:yes gene_type:complete